VPSPASLAPSMCSFVSTPHGQRTSTHGPRITHGKSSSSSCSSAETPFSPGRGGCQPPGAPGFAASVCSVRADGATQSAVRQLVERTYLALSTPGSQLGEAFGHADLAVAGSGIGELLHGPDEVVPVATAISAQGMSWVPEAVTVWRRGDIAWAQILGYVEKQHDDDVIRVPYWTTGVFGLVSGRWQWVYWGGSEPQETPRV